MLEQSEPLASLVASVIFVVFGIVFWRSLHSGASSAKAKGSSNEKLVYPPSPKERHWLWKHGAVLAGDDREFAHSILFLRWMKKLDSKVVTFEIPLLGRMIVVGDAGLAKHVLMSRSKKALGGVPAFPKSPTYKSIFPLLGRKSIVASEGAEWFHQRRAFNPGFSPDYLRGTVATIAQKCDRLLEFCEEEDMARGVPTDMLSRAIDLTSDVIAQVAYGEDWGEHSTEEHGGFQTLGTFRELTSLIGTTMLNPLVKLNPLVRYKIHKLSVSLDNDFQRLVRRRIASIEQQNGEPQEKEELPKDILSLTLSSTLKAKKDDRKATSQSLSQSFSADDMECMTSQLKTFYFAGHDTTATTISWAFWLLLQNPEALQRARDEVAEVLGKEWVESLANSDEPVVPKEAITYENLQKCQYLDAVCRETLRLYPPAGSGRYAVDPDESYQNYKLGNCVVAIDVYCIHRDPELWGDDAESFRPERFLGEEGRKKITSFGFLPFSKGPRDCIGKYFALLEAKTALASLVTRYDGTVVDADREIYTSRLTNMPKNGCKVLLSRRETTPSQTSISAAPQ